MARKSQLREQRAGTIINLTSKIRETSMGQALVIASERLRVDFGLQLRHEREWKLTDVIKRLRKHFPEVEFVCHFQTSAMRPDGGILSIEGTDDELFPILIGEHKNQGTNDLRAAEGKSQQAKGNAIERLGKNTIGFRTALMHEGITPFVCFGDGCDFADDSYILDRVTTIAMFGALNKVRVVDEGSRGQFDRGTFFLRIEAWTPEEMAEIMYEVGKRSIHYYFSKYSEGHFRKAVI
jgi:type II restriction enzyme